MGFTRREMLVAGGVGCAALANAWFSRGNAAETAEKDETADFVVRQMGRAGN